MTPLGEDLLNDEESKDFELIVTDGRWNVAVATHRLVLRTSSRVFREKLGGRFKFWYTWVVPPGYVSTALRLVKFFYTRNHAYIVDRRRTMELSLRLQCPGIYASLLAVPCTSDTEEDTQVYVQDVPPPHKAVAKRALTRRRRPHTRASARIARKRIRADARARRSCSHRYFTRQRPSRALVRYI